MNMYKKITLVFVLLFSQIAVQSQKIDAIEMLKLLRMVGREAYDSAYQGSLKMLEAEENANNNYRGMAVYINILSAQGLVSKGKMTHQQLLDHVNGYKGQKIISGPYPYADSGTLRFNAASFQTLNGVPVGKITTTNPDGTSIFAFEDYRLIRQPAKIEWYKGKLIGFSGILEEIKVNPNESTIWISRLYVQDATVMVFTGW